MSLRQLFASELPMNRKERYFTGTVLPMVICRQELGHLNLFFDLIDGMEPTEIIAKPEAANVQFLTEYSLVESIFGAQSGRFPDPPSQRDTPDVMIHVVGRRKTLVAVEAKLYSNPSRFEMQEQLRAQQAILEYLRGALSIDDVHHVALLPEPLAARLRPIGWPIVTWEQIVAAYEPVAGQDYFMEVLRLAVEGYDDLASRGSTSGQHCEQKVAGGDIVRQHAKGRSRIRIVGRQGGVTGQPFQQDLADGSWRTRAYETSSAAEPPNENWMRIEDFIAAIAQGE